MTRELLKFRLRSGDEISTMLWGALWRLSLGVLVLLVIAVPPRLSEPDMAHQSILALLVLASINAFFYALHRACRRWREAVEREWPDLEE